MSTGHGRKNDDADAVSVAIAAHTAPHLQSVEVDQALGALRVLVEHRDDLIKARTQTANRLHRLLTELVPAGAGHRRLTPEIASQLLRRTRPRDPSGRATRRVAVELTGELRRLDHRISTAETDVATGRGGLAGVDETAYLAATATHGTEFATGLVDLTRRSGPAPLLDVVPGRSGAVLSTWLRERDAGWRSQVALAALDPFRGYASALRTHLPTAVRVLDAFHVIKLGFDAVDQVRRLSSRTPSGTAAAPATRSMASAGCCAAATTTTATPHGRGCCTASTSATPMATWRPPGSPPRTYGCSTATPTPPAPPRPSTAG